jgi:NADPH:quinone reductase-like Zn-dependent oxidoreductase
MEDEMRAYQILPGDGIDGLQCVEVPERELGNGEVRVRVHAVSLNYRDLMVASGNYLVNVDNPIVPCSDGAGEVLAVGPGVTRVQVGDRVAGSFFPYWHDGPVAPEKIRHALGGDIDGMLAEEVILDEDALAKIPAAMSFVDAATMPCAGVTAWNAIFESSNNIRPGDTVLLLGTGGVSVLGLQLARAAGLKAIITSSSDEKLQRARELGAHHTINYRSFPEWQEDVLRATHGVGAHVVLEVGGKGTVNRHAAGHLQAHGRHLRRQPHDARQGDALCRYLGHPAGGGPGVHVRPGQGRVSVYGIGLALRQGRHRGGAITLTAAAPESIRSRTIWATACR